MTPRIGAAATARGGDGAREGARGGTAVARAGVRRDDARGRARRAGRAPRRRGGRRARAGADGGPAAATGAATCRAAGISAP